MAVYTALTRSAFVGDDPSMTSHSQSKQTDTQRHPPCALPTCIKDHNGGLRAHTSNTIGWCFILTARATCPDPTASATTHPPTKPVARAHTLCVKTQVPILTVCFQLWSRQKRKEKKKKKKKKKTPQQSQLTTIRARILEA